VRHRWPQQDQNPPQIGPKCQPVSCKNMLAALYTSTGRAIESMGNLRAEDSGMRKHLMNRLIVGVIGSAPNFTLALNARGFVRVLLHEWAPAIEDLDRAIRINPKYANAYRVRAAARRSIGDVVGGGLEKSPSGGPLAPGGQQNWWRARLACALDRRLGRPCRKKTTAS
jgi:hypothetical protein